jgi:hypothetical protein
LQNRPLESKKVEITAQDHRYCENCKETLRVRLGIRAVTTLEAHLALTRNAITLSIAPGAPVC